MLRTLSLLLHTNLVFAYATSSQCKSTTLDPNWPSEYEWRALNSSIDGALIASSPIASSCWVGSKFESQVPCETVKNSWKSGFFHSEAPESIGSNIYANNSCLPPGATGYNQERGCEIGGAPRYIVKATTEQQVATAMKWAAERNIRIVVKGTGHDLNGRSSGAHSLSIWTRGFWKIERSESWTVPGAQRTEDVFIVGSGQQWGNILTEALKIGRVVTTGQDPSVGLGGYIQGGGHGPVASTYGLAAQQVLQVTVVTTKGDILVANHAQNQDLFWALRGGGAGQYGVVTEYVIRHHPAPAKVIMGNLLVAPKGVPGENSSWDAAATIFRALPDLMDAGLAGASTLATGASAMSFSPSLTSPTKGAVMGLVLWAFNTTEASLHHLVDPITSRLRNQTGNSTLEITFTTSTFANYSSFYSVISGSDVAGSESLMASRLLGRAELTEIPHYRLVSYIRRAMISKNATQGMYATIGMSGGPGVQNAAPAQWGALHPGWRSAYLHFMAGGAQLSSLEAGSPKKALEDAAAWTGDMKEKVFREWAPGSGAYMNEANPYNQEFKEDFYGASYEKLLEIKRKYDPSESLFVLSGVGSDGWTYDLDSGRLCRTG